MTSRERTLALVLIGAVALTVVVIGGYLFVWQPIQDNAAEQAKLDDEIKKLTTEAQAQAASAKRLAVARTRSLPADADLAKREYVVALERLLETAGAPKGYTISLKASDNSARSVPEIAKGKPIYTRVAYDVEIKKADMWVIKDFLKGYYELGLLHQITNFSIKKDDDAGAKGPPRRNDLSVKLTTEAVLVDGADTRRTLLPVPTAFAAVGGGGLLQAMRATPEAGRGVTPKPLVPVLSPNGRDYSLIVLKDPFNGPLAPPPGFKLSPIKDVVVTQDGGPTPVKVALSGEGSQGARVTAVVSGGPFPEGALKVDPKSHAIELPKTSASEGTATVTVYATSVEGKSEKTAFKVSVEAKKGTEERAVVDKRDEVSGAIILTMLTFRSDGTATAAIRDNANKQRYVIELDAKGAKIMKERFGKHVAFEGKDERKVERVGWFEDEAHKKQAPGVLNLSDETSKTNRTFKVVAVDADGLILADLRPDGAPIAPAAPKAGGKGAGGMFQPGGGGFGGKGGGGGPPKQGPANPLAAIAGGMAGTIPAAPSKLYRWSVGQSLATVAGKQIPDEDAKKIIKQADATGPMFASVPTGN